MALLASLFAAIPSAAAQEATLTCEELPPESNPSNACIDPPELEVSRVSSSSVRLSWDPPVRGGDYYGYLIWITSPDEEPDFNDPNVCPDSYRPNGGGPIETVCDVGDLDSDTDYKVWAYVHAIAKTVTPGLSSTTFTTLPEIENLRVSNIVGSTARVDWDDRSAGTPYVLWVETVGIPRERDVAVSDCPGTQRTNNPDRHCNLIQLEPGVQYRVSVRRDIPGREDTPALSAVFTAEPPAPEPPNPEPPAPEPPVVEPEPEPDPCKAGGEHFKKRAKKVRVANKKFRLGIEKWTDRLEDRPKKLAKKVRHLQNTREGRIDRARTAYAAACR